MLDSLLQPLSGKSRADVSQAVATLTTTLEPGEEPHWLGYVLGEHAAKRYALVVTDQRLLLADSRRQGHWEALDILDLAEHGVILPRTTLLTLVASTPVGTYRRELRPIDPPTFDDIRWPAEAEPLIEKRLAEADGRAPRREWRRPWRRTG